MGGCRRGRLVILVPRVSLVEGFAADGIGCNVPFGSRGSLGGAVGAEEFGGTGVGVVFAMVVLCDASYSNGEIWDWLQVRNTGIVQCYTNCL